MALKQKLHLADCVRVVDFFDLKAGSELGLENTTCQDAILGYPTKASYPKRTPKIG